MAAQTHFVALSPSMRQQIEATIEHLVAMLDTIDGDPDLEPDNDGEPWLGWTYFDGRPVIPNMGGDDDREQEVEDDDDGDYEDGGDDEAYLAGSTNDLEDDPSDSGIGDEDGLLEIFPHMHGCEVAAI